MKFQQVQEFSINGQYQVGVRPITDMNECEFTTASVDISFAGCILPEAFSQLRFLLASEDIFTSNTLEDLMKSVKILIDHKKEFFKSLSDETVLSQWATELISMERFKMMMLRWVALCSNAPLKVKMSAQKQMKELLHPFSENNLPQDVPELLKVFSVLSTTLNDSKINDKSYDIKSFMLFILQCKKSGQVVLEDLNTNISLLFKNLEGKKCFSLCSAVIILLKPFQLDQIEKQFPSSFDSAYIGNMLDELKKFTSMYLGQNMECEIDTLDSLVSTAREKEQVIRKYIILRESYSPSTITPLLRKYLPFWKEGEIEDVLKSIRRKGSVDDFLIILPKEETSVMRQEYDPMKQPFLSKEIEGVTKSRSKYPSTKITRDQIYSINLPSSHEDQTDENVQFLKQLLSLDYHCRNASKELIKQVSTSPECINEEEFYSANLNKPFVSNSNNEEKSSADNVIHTLSRCDDFLLQDVFQKMSACQLAVPIVVCNDNCLTFHLWASRTIRKTWKSSVDGVLSHEGFIAGIKMSCISFCRFGPTSVSKSKLINGFISTIQGWPEHSYFLNRDMDTPSTLNDGSIEAIWYCPEGRQREHLKDINSIYNLRGDAKNHTLQFQFLLSVSSLIVILLENHELREKEKQFLQLAKNKIVLIDLSKDGPIRSMRNKKMLSALNMNPKTLLESLRDSIPTFLDYKTSLEDHASIISEMGVEIDETKKECLMGKNAAKEFLRLINKYEIGDLKKNVVPLQGDIWKNWCKEDKEEARQQWRGETNPQEYSSNLRDKKNNLRYKQCCMGPSREIDFFLGQLLSIKTESAQRYFLDWCQMELNALSEKFLPGILKEYNKSSKVLQDLIKELEKMQKNPQLGKRECISEINHKIIQEKSNLKKLSEKFSIASFGICLN